MAYAELMRALAENPDGLILDDLDQVAVQEAEEAGYVSVSGSWAVGCVLLTDAGRRLVGLPALPTWWEETVDPLIRVCRMLWR
jgi:hypothetical protein